MLHSYNAYVDFKGNWKFIPQEKKENQNRKICFNGFFDPFKSGLKESQRSDNFSLTNSLTEKEIDKGFKYIERVRKENSIFSLINFSISDGGVITVFFLPAYCVQELLRKDLDTSIFFKANLGCVSWRGDLNPHIVEQMNLFLPLDYDVYSIRIPLNECTNIPYFEKGKCKWEFSECLIASIVGGKRQPVKGKRGGYLPDCSLIDSSFYQSVKYIEVKAHCGRLCTPRDWHKPPEKK